MITRPSSVILVFAICSVMLLSNTQAQDCTQQLTISAADSINADAGTTIDIDVMVENTGTCSIETPVVATVPKGWSATQFLVTLSPGGKYLTEDNPLKITIPADGQTSTITLLAESAEPLNIDVIIGGAPAQEESTQPAEEPVPINTTPLLPVNTTPEIKQETTQPAEQNAPQESSGQLIMNTEPQPQAEQPASSVTGMITSNPAAQAAILGLIVFGAGYFLGRGRGEGFRYRFKR